ncbi:PAS domain S-box protein [bacterium]|nr:PAS domain S-box protein [bacterium]
MKRIGFGVKGKILFMAILMAFATASIVFHRILHVSPIFMHFFYIPIIFACIWWRWKGIWVAVFLALNVLFCHLFYDCAFASVYDVAQPVMFILVALIIINLRTGLVKAEEETDQAFHEIGQIFRTTRNGLRVIDRDFNMIRFNDAFLKLSGLNEKEATGKKCFDAFSCPPDCHTPRCVLRRILEGEDIVECETEAKHSEGSRIFCTLTATPLRGTEGEIIGIVEDIKDITERRLWEERLRSSEERYRSFVKGIGGIAYQCDMDYSPIFFHGAIEQITGYTEDEFNAGAPRLVQIIHRDDIRRVYKNSRNVCKPPDFPCIPYEQEYRIVRKDGQIRWVREYIQNACDHSGNPRTIQGILYDITDQKETEDALQKSEEKFMHAQKMEAIGRLAGGIAHDFNNILTIIMGNTDLLLDKVKDHSLLCDIEEIHRAGERAASLVSRILTFSRKQMIQPKVLDFTALLAETGKLIRRIIGEDIRLTVRLDPDLFRVKADPGQMDQAIMNLVVNARDAMPNGGDLTIRVENVMLDRDQCKAIPDARPGRSVRLSVEDTGTGMDKALLDHIFEPFFTTKMQGEGTGLGLSTVYGIVKQHEGWINVYSKPGYGSTFEIYLPAISQMPATGQKKTPSLEAFQGSGERVLVVEDDEGVRRFTKKALEANGYAVFEASSALEAFSIYEREHGDFELVLSDVVLPDINGVQFADQILARDPDLPVILCSGYANVKSQWPLIHERHFRFIKKPYSAYELLRTIKEETDSKKVKTKQDV